MNNKATEIRKEMEEAFKKGSKQFEIATRGQNVTFNLEPIFREPKPDDDVLDKYVLRIMENPREG